MRAVLKQLLESFWLVLARLTGWRPDPLRREQLQMAAAVLSIIAGIHFVWKKAWQEPRLHEQIQRELSEIRAEREKLRAQVVAAQSARAATPSSEAERERAGRRIEGVIRELSERRDPRSSEVLARLKQGDTAPAEQLFDEIRIDKAQLGRKASSDAAQAARSHAALVRLRDVMQAADLYLKSVELAPDQLEGWLDLGDTSLLAGRLKEARLAYETLIDRAQSAGDERMLAAGMSGLGELDLRTRTLDQALGRFRQAQKILDSLARQGEGDDWLDRERVEILKHIGDTLFEQGDLGGAREAFAAAIALIEGTRRRRGVTLVNLRSDEARREQRTALASLHERIGKVERVAGRHGLSRSAYETSLTIRERLVADDPRNTLLWRELAVSHRDIGVVRDEEGDLIGALASHNSAIAIRRQLVEWDAGNLVWQQDLAWSQDNAGWILLALGRDKPALEAFEAGQAIRARLAAANPDDVQMRRQLAISGRGIAQSQRRSGDLAAARRAIEGSLGVRREIAAADPSNSRFVRDVAVAERELAEILAESGDAPAARKLLQASIPGLEKLVAGAPDYFEWHRDLALSQRLLGTLQAARATQAEAKTLLAASHATLLRLAGTNRRNLDWQRDLATSHVAQAALAASNGQKPESIAALEQARSIVEGLVARSPDHSEWTSDLFNIHRELARARRAPTQ